MRGYKLPSGAVVGGGEVVAYLGTNQAANVEFSEVVPANELWEVRMVSVPLAQGLTQTPLPTLIIDDGTNVLFQQPGASAAQSASVTSQYTWAPGLPLTAGAGLVQNSAPFPSGLLLPPGCRIRSSTAGKGANTDFGAPSILIVRFRAT